MYNDTVTVFNRKGELWYPAVLEGVHLVVSRQALAARFGWQNAGRALLLVPVDRQGLVGGREYAPPKAWRQAPDPSALVTFDEADGACFFIRGGWDGPCPVPDGEGLYDSLNRRRDGVFALAGVTRYRALPHFEITGR